VLPLINGLCDNDAHIIILNVLQNKPREHQPHFRRNINKYTVAEFKHRLSYETCDLVFESDEVNTIFNAFLNIYLRTFYSSFPFIKSNKVTHNNYWMMTGVQNFL
jgi:hypothetical protein